MVFFPAGAVIPTPALIAVKCLPLSIQTFSLRCKLIPLHAKTDFWNQLAGYDYDEALYPFYDPKKNKK